MWLQDDNQHSFPVKTPEANFLPGAKARFEKDFELTKVSCNVTQESVLVFDDLPEALFQSF